MAVPACERFQYWRERLGLNQEEIGKRCKMAQYKISRLETGKTPAKADVLELVVVRGLRISMPEFYAATRAEIRARAS